MIATPPPPAVVVVGCSIQKHDGSLAGQAAQNVAGQSQQASAWSWLIGAAVGAADTYSQIVVTIENHLGVPTPAIRVRVVYGDGSVQYLNGQSIPIDAHEVLTTRTKGDRPTCTLDPSSSPTPAPAGGV